MIKFIKHRVNEVEVADPNFGAELDVWSYNNMITVSHDAPLAPNDKLKRLLELKLPMYAVNGKSTNLEALVDDLAGLDNYFIFDLPVPEAVKLLKRNLNVWTRLSEYEQHPPFYREAKGVWIDMFNSDWLTPTDINTQLSTYNNDSHTKKGVAITSPELHGRNPIPFWNVLKQAEFRGDFYLCTKHPEEARKVIYGV